MSSPLQTHHIASLTNEKKTSGKKSQDKSKNKNTFNVPDLAKAAAKAAKRLRTQRTLNSTLWRKK